MNRKSLDNIEEIIREYVSQRIAPNYWQLLNGNGQDYHVCRIVFDHNYLPSGLNEDEITEIEKRTFEFHEKMFNLGYKNKNELESALREGKIPEKEIISILIDEKEKTINTIRLEPSIIQAMILGYIKKTKNEFFRYFLKQEVYEIIFHLMIDRELVYLT